MTTDQLHPRAEGYLRSLEREGAQLPPERLRELTAEIRAHLAEAIPPGASDPQVDAALNRLGSPADIIDAERPEGQRPNDQRRRSERAAVMLLPLGGFALGVGWLVGVALLWRSRLWSTREKLLGTLIVPGGIASIIPVALLLATKRKCMTLARTSPTTGTLIRTHCAPQAGPSAATSTWHIALILICILGPILTATYLARRARIRSAFLGTQQPA